MLPDILAERKMYNKVSIQEEEQQLWDTLPSVAEKKASKVGTTRWFAVIRAAAKLLEQRSMRLVILVCSGRQFIIFV